VKPTKVRSALLHAPYKLIATNLTTCGLDIGPWPPEVQAEKRFRNMTAVVERLGKLCGWPTFSQSES